MRAALTLALCLAAPLAAAQTPAAARPAQAPSPSAPATPATPAAGATPSVPREVTPFQAAVNRGATAYHDRNLEGAATAFREAARLDARSPVPQLYLAYVALAQGNAATALSTFREAARMAQSAGDDQNRGRALVGIALVHESQQRWDDARNTWQEYATFGDAHSQVTFPATGRARVEAIQRRATLDQEYAPVRERIAERQRINASGQNQQAPAGTVVAPVAPGTMPAGAVVTTPRR